MRPYFRADRWGLRRAWFLLIEWRWVEVQAEFLLDTWAFGVFLQADSWPCIGAQAGPLMVSVGRTRKGYVRDDRVRELSLRVEEAERDLSDYVKARDLSR